MAAFKQYINESFVSNHAHNLGLKYMGYGYWGDGTHATHKSQEGVLQKLLTPHPITHNHEGSLANIPPHWKAHLVKNNIVGDSSEVVHTHPTEEMTSFSKFKKHVSELMASSDKTSLNGIMINVNGSPAGMITFYDGYSARQEFLSFDTDGVKTKTLHGGGKWIRGRDSRGNTHFQTPRTQREVVAHQKGEAFDTLYNSLSPFMGDDETLESKSFWKNNKVDIVTLGVDKHRAQEKKERAEQRKTKPVSDESISAATKFVNKKLNQTSSDTAAEIKQHHAELMDMMNSGVSANELRAKADTMLNLHISSQENTSDNEHIIRDLAQKNYSRGYGLRALRRKMSNN